MERRTITQDELRNELLRRFGTDPYKWAFVCPACGTVQTAQSFVDAGFERGKGEINKYLGFTCVGRFSGQGDEGISAHQKGQAWSKGCNWTLGGLLKIHTLEVVEWDGRKVPLWFCRMFLSMRLTVFLLLGGVTITIFRGALPFWLGIAGFCLLVLGLFASVIHRFVWMWTDRTPRGVQRWFSGEREAS